MRLTSKFSFLVVVGLLVLISTLFLFSRYVNQQAKQEAKIFCSSIRVDESLESLLEKCKTTERGCFSWEPIDGVVRHQAWFDGFLLNSYACEISTKSGIVISSFFEEHAD